MTQTDSDLHRANLLPAGSRWGFGAQSVVQYLTTSAPARHLPPAEVDMEAERSIQNPVFVHMEHTLRALRQRH
jgi:hypothetical protein